MRSVISFFLKNSVAANLLMVFLLIVGIFSLLQIKTTFFPEQPSRFINIQTVYPGASPEEMEEGVVTKIEENMIGIKGVKRTSSTSNENSANVIVEVERGFDIDLAVQDVKNAVDRINSFPISMEPPIIFKQEQLAESYIFSLSADLDLKTLKSYARIAEDELLAIDGISNVKLDGFPAEEIEISFRESDMRALNITFDEAVSAVAQTNLLSTGGTIKTEKEELLIRAKNKNYYASEFRDIIIRSSQNGGLIRLDQIANVEDKWEDNPTRTYVNGDPAVLVTVYNTLEEDMFQNSNSTETYLKDFNKKYPEITTTMIRNGKQYLNTRINFLKENGLIGFVLVLVLLALFLNLRLAFWVALAIPLSFAGMFIAASYLGITINVISTFGMIVVIGILVDDGIVIAENIYQHYERGAKAMDAALNGTMEVLPAVTSAIITTVVAFSTFFFIDGFLGDVFKELAIVVIFTLIFSLIEGALILPAHIAHSKALREGNGSAVTQFFDSIMDFMRHKMYGPILNFSMKFPIPTLSICIAGLLLVVGAFQGGLIKGTFFPFVQQDDFRIDLELPSGAREAEVFTLLDSINKAAWATNDELSEEYYGGEKNIIEKVEMTVGPNTNVGRMRVYLLNGEEREGLSNRIVTKTMREKLGPIHDAKKLIFGLGNIFGDPVSISLLSTNSEALSAAVKELKSEMTKIPDLVDIDDSNKIGLKEVSLNLKPKAYNLGFTLGDIMRYVRQGFFGAEIQRLQRGQDEVKVWVRFAEEDRSSLTDLSLMRIRTPQGQSIPLADLVSFETERGVLSINHIDGQREIRVTADVGNDKASVSDINSDINTVLIPRVLEKYPDVKVGIEGQARDQQEVMASMQRVLPMILLVMLFIIIITFSSVSQALIVFMLIPFGFIGVGFGHWFMGLPISLLSILGVIALIGIFINDALVFISTFNNKIKVGNNFKTALYDTGVSRFRPITLTTATTVAGLLPLLLDNSVQAQFLIPMAIAVAFGLMIGTFFLLVLIPALLSMANVIRRFSTQLWIGEPVSAVSVEPAYEDRIHPWGLTLIFAIVFLAFIAMLVFACLQISQFIA